MYNIYWYGRYGMVWQETQTSLVYFEDCKRVVDAHKWCRFFFSTKNLSPEGKAWPTCMYMYVVPALVKIQAAATKIYIST